MAETVEIYTDGACQGNPGPGGWGVVMIWGEHIKELSGGERMTTNNRMELIAVIKSLEALTRKTPVIIYSDSQYVILGITKWIHSWKRQGWKRKQGVLENIDLWQHLSGLAEQHKIEWKWVRGHSGTVHNERADKLAVAAIPAGTKIA